MNTSYRISSQKKFDGQQKREITIRSFLILYTYTQQNGYEEYGLKTVCTRIDQWRYNTYEESNKLNKDR